MKRVLVIGSGGSGKSTLARHLADRTGLPLIHLDALYWRAGWQEMPKQEWAHTVEQILQQDAWVMDGNYGGTLERRLKAADTVVFLDLSRWICLGLAVRRRGKRRRSESPRPVRETLSGTNERWSMDFVTDSLSSGRRFRCLTVLDEFNRECVAIHPAHSIPAVAVIEVLERLREERGLPSVIVTDNGSEFTSRAFDAWAYARGVKIEYIQPGKPVQNAFIESFNGTFRDECLNMHWSFSLAEAKPTIEEWRRDYNEFRPHSSLRGQSPAEYVGCQSTSEEPKPLFNAQGVPQ